MKSDEAGNSYNLLYVFEKNTLEIIDRKKYCVILQCKNVKRKIYEEFV